MSTEPGEISQREAEKIAAAVLAASADEQTFRKEVLTRLVQLETKIEIIMLGRLGASSQYRDDDPNKYRFEGVSMFFRVILGLVGLVGAIGGAILWVLSLGKHTP